MDDKIIRVLISSPTDVWENYKETIETAINRKSNSFVCYENAYGIRFSCSLLQWLVNSIATYEPGATAQDVLNTELVQKCDCVIAIFFSRIGKPTAKYLSGTVEEIEIGNKLNKQVGILWIRESIPQKYVEKIEEVSFWTNWKALLKYLNEDNKGLAVWVNNKEELCQAIELQIDKWVANYLSRQGVFSSNNISIQNESGRTIVDDKQIERNVKYVIRSLDNCNDYNTLLSLALREVCAITKTDYNQIALSVRRSNYDIALMVFADNIAEHKQAYRTVRLDGVIGEAFVQGEPIIDNFIRNNENYLAAAIETQSEAVIPIIYQGQIVGVINSESERKGYYTDEMKNELCKLADAISIILKKVGYKKDMPFDSIPYIHDSNIIGSR